MKILYVDDDPLWLGLIKEMLREVAGEGSQVVTALTGTQALSIIERFPLDLAIVDISLCDMSGYDLIHRAKELKPELQVAVLTGSRDLSVSAKAKSEGAAYCLSKPISLDAMRQFIERVRESIDKSADEHVNSSISA
ncbi:MAG: response regulator [Chitinivibrionales bacterium]|nr:response regulator [Chitinivibrionales bacterium]